MTLFRDRREAGRLLAERLRNYANRPDVVVLGLPRGGVLVAYEVAQALHVPLDIFLVRKLGVPGYEELAMGAIASGGVRVLNTEVLDALNIPPDDLEEVVAAEQRELDRRQRAYRGDRPDPQLRGKTVILVDDGLATGSTMRAAITAIRTFQPARVVVAVPVGAPDTCAEMQQEADEVLCLAMPEPFYAVGLWYDDFTQTTDEEISQLLSRAPRQPAAAS